MAAKKVTPKVLASAGDTKALQLQGETQNAVAIWNLSVLIVPDDGFWFAQGLEINYGAQGDTAEDAQKNFQEGLLATIKQHLRMYGHIEGMLKFAPNSILREAAQQKAHIKRFAQVSFHDILGASAKDVKLPFDQIEYRVVQAAAAA